MTSCTLYRQVELVGSLERCRDSDRVRTNTEAKLVLLQEQSAQKDAQLAAFEGRLAQKDEEMAEITDSARKLKIQHE